MLVEIADLAGRDAVVAVGETGLDFYREYSPVADQHRAFESHILLAKSVDKTLIIHTRESIDAALDTLERVGPPDRLVFHCWSGGEPALRRAVEIGAYISFAGNVTFKNAENLRSIVPLVPEDRLVMETDSPFLAPGPHRGMPNQPLNITHIAETLARVLGTGMQDVSDRTTSNAARLFAIP
jgi:TatD DNase family protein